MNKKKAIKALIREFKKKEIISVPDVVYSDCLLKDKVAIISGGSSGIGLAIAKEFIKNKCKVIILSRDLDKINKAIREIGENAKGIVWDLKDVSSYESRMKEAVELFDDNRIDILVNCAGVLTDTEYMNITEDEFDEVMQVNCKATFFLSREVAKFMIDNEIKGHILNISSSSALRPGWTPYQMSKWAIRGFTLGLADMLLPHGIVVNAIAPGPTITPMQGLNENDSLYNESFPNKRYALPRELAALAVYMVSSLGDLIIGDTIYATGGSGLLDIKR